MQCILYEGTVVEKDLQLILQVSYQPRIILWKRVIVNC
jgi:hypothetical protein